MKLLLFANTDWYLYNFRRALAGAMRDAGHEVLLVSPPGPYGEKLRALGFRWLAAPMRRRSLNPLREAMLVLWLRGVIRRERVDLVHNFSIKCAVYGAIAARMAGGAAHVNELTGLGYVFTGDRTTVRLLRGFVAALMRGSLDGGHARLVVQNTDDRTLVERERLAPASLIRLIPGSGVDCARFAPPANKARGARFRVVLPARLLWDKGLAEYVAAAQRLRNEGRAIDLLPAGTVDDGNPASAAESDVRSWVDAGLVQWLGHVDDMPALFRSVDAVVLPSYREGMPRGLIEAGACGLPLVTTDVPGCREAVIDGVDGLLVPVRDAAALAAAIARLHDDPALCARLGAAARRKALREFDKDIVIAQTIAVYSELLPDAFLLPRLTSSTPAASPLMPALPHSSCTPS